MGTLNSQCGSRALRCQQNSAWGTGPVDFNELQALLCMNHSFRGHRQPIWRTKKIKMGDENKWIRKMKRNKGKNIKKGENSSTVGARAEHRIAHNAAVPWEVSAALLTLVLTRNKGGREKHDCKVAIIRLFISILKMMRKKGNWMYCTFWKKKLFWN